MILLDLAVRARERADYVRTLTSPGEVSPPMAEQLVADAETMEAYVFGEGSDG